MSPQTDPESYFPVSNGWQNDLEGDIHLIKMITSVADIDTFSDNTSLILAR